MLVFNKQELDNAEVERSPALASLETLQVLLSILAQDQFSCNNAS